MTGERLALSEKAFMAELTTHLDALRRFSTSLTKKPDRGEDLAQDALLKAWAARDRFEAGTNMKAWLFMIARNQFYTDRRRAWRNVEMAEGQAERVPQASSQLHALELKDALTALTYLPDDTAGLILAAADGVSIEEMAADFGLAEGTVKSRLSRARDALDTYFSGT